MATLTSFLPYVLPHVTGCPDPLAEQAVRSACIEFCEETLLVQEVSTQSSIASQQDYDIDVPTDMILVRVTGVFYGDTWLDPSSIENIRSGVALRGAVGTATQTLATPTVYFQKTPNATTISLYPVPDTALANGLAIRAAFAPSRSATTVPDLLYDFWVEEIAAGAIARLKAIPGQPFSDPATVANYLLQFNEANRAGSIEARVGRVAAASRVRLTRFV